MTWVIKEPISVRGCSAMGYAACEDARQLNKALSGGVGAGTGGATAGKDTRNGTFQQIRNCVRCR